MPTTSQRWIGFHFLLLGACASPPPAAVQGTAAPAEVQGTAAPAEVPGTATPAAAVQGTAAPAPPEASLGVQDTGIWSDLDAEVKIELPADGALSAVVRGEIVIVEVDGWPVKPYPLGGTVEVAGLMLRPGDAAELAGRLDAKDVRTAELEDHDGDALPDPLDVLIGAKKAAIQAGEYGAGYLTLDYPGGDVPRDRGVCTDVVVRAMRNAGVDLQEEVHRDIAKHPKAYPMVKKRGGDKNIDHRRVKTILPWFKRHMEAHTAALDDPDDPLRPGDIIFMDTFPDRAGPDHIGVISDRLGDDGLPLVINSWTTGYVTQEMDLLGFVPVTHRFRL